MVAFRAVILFTLLWFCSASRNNLAGHAHRRVQQEKTKHSACEALKARVSRPGFWTTLLLFVSAPVGDAFVAAGLQPLTAPGIQSNLARRNVASPRALNVTMRQQGLENKLQNLGRRTVLAGGLGVLAESVNKALLESDWVGMADMAREEKTKSNINTRESNKERILDSTLKWKYNGQKYKVNIFQPEVQQEVDAATKLVIDSFESEQGEYPEMEEDLEGAFRALGLDPSAVDIQAVKDKITEQAFKCGYPELLTPNIEIEYRDIDDPALQKVTKKIAELSDRADLDSEWVEEVLKNKDLDQAGKLEFIEAGLGKDGEDDRLGAVISRWAG